MECRHLNRPDLAHDKLVRRVRSTNLAVVPGTALTLILVQDTGWRIAILHATAATLFAIWGWGSGYLIGLDIGRSETPG